MKNIKSAHIFAFVVAGAGLGFLAYSLWQIASQPPSVAVPIASKPPVLSAAPSLPATTTKKVMPLSPISPAGITYEQALITYKNSRMQFGPSCQASPTSISLKNGAKLMLDNRASSSRTILIGGVRHPLAAYGFSIVTISQMYLPAKLSVDCPPAENIATIFVNK